MTVETSTWATKKGLAQMLKGGVIMDVVTPDQAKIAEDAGAVAVMALERVPSDIRAAGGVARMSDPTMIVGIMDAVSIPVMAKARIGHFVEAQVLEALGVDYIDESEVLTPADEAQPHRQARLQGPVRVRLPEPRRGAPADQRRRRDDADQGRGRDRQHRRGGPPHPRRPGRDPPAPGHARGRAVRRGQGAPGARTSSCKRRRRRGQAAGRQLRRRRHRTPADAALVMQLGAEGVFVGSGIFKSEDPARMANAIVQATTHFDDPKKIAEVSKGLGAPMRGIALEADPGRRSGSPSAAGRPGSPTPARRRVASP